MALGNTRRTSIASTTPPERQVPPKVIFISALAHAIFVIAALLLPSAPEGAAPSEDSIAVEIIPQLETPKVSQPVFPQVAVPKAGKVEEAREFKEASAGQSGVNPSKPTDNPSQPVKPTRMLSEVILADRRSSQAKEALSQLAPAEQIEQLCNLEAMAQVAEFNKELKPDRVVVYAMADTKLERNSFLAEGAAVHSGKSWSRLRFKCDLMPDHKKVSAFEFIVGEPIPREQWADHNLPDEEESFD
ncbi:DUF930 domain-containing protein [Agrobacterium tumefaciens]|nr:DUF930 domain-containing protein [Agrobacterium tumefaciens]